jgi:hypothetical protein
VTDADLTAAKRAAAKRITEAEWPADSYVYWDEQHGPHDGYFDSPTALRAFCADEGLAVPADVWGTTWQPFTGLDAQAIVDNEVEGGDWHEDLADGLDVAGLQAVLDAWMAEQTAGSWFADFTTLVVLDGPPGAAGA